jgi:transcription initiation factor TFIID subunit 12
MLGKRKLSALLGTIDPLEKLDPDVEDVLLDVADEFIESVVGFACKLAKHRKSDVLKMEDIKVVLEKEWNIRAMGFADERSESRKKLPKEGTKEYRGKLAAVQTAKSLQ